jgi:hypothetical protein
MLAEKCERRKNFMQRDCIFSGISAAQRRFIAFFTVAHRPREVDKCVTWCCSARVAKHILCNAPPIRAARAPFDVFTEREARAFCVYLNSEKQCTDM